MSLEIFLFNFLIMVCQCNVIDTEIWLEPKRKVYGPSYASGRIRIALTRGNKDLVHNGNQIGNSVLESDVIMGTAAKIQKKSILREKPEGWNHQFHNYTVIWEPGKT